MKAMARNLASVTAILSIHTGRTKPTSFRRIVSYRRPFFRGKFLCSKKRKTEGQVSALCHFHVSALPGPSCQLQRRDSAGAFPAGETSCQRMDSTFNVHQLLPWAPGPRELGFTELRWDGEQKIEGQECFVSEIRAGWAFIPQKCDLSRCTLLAGFHGREWCSENGSPVISWDPERVCWMRDRDPCCLLSTSQRAKSNFSSKPSILLIQNFSGTVSKMAHPSPPRSLLFLAVNHTEKKQQEQQRGDISDCAGVFSEVHTKQSTNKNAGSTAVCLLCICDNLHHRLMRLCYILSLNCDFLFYH